MFAAAALAIAGLVMFLLGAMVERNGYKWWQLITLATAVFIAGLAFDVWGDGASLVIVSVLLVLSVAAYYQAHREGQRALRRAGDLMDALRDGRR